MNVVPLPTKRLIIGTQVDARRLSRGGDSSGKAHGESTISFPRMVLCIAILVLGTVFSRTRVQAEGQERAPIQVRTKIQFAETDAGALYLDLYAPKTQSPGPSPGILVIHGGAWCAGNRRELTFHARKLAEAGYIAACIDYRLAPKHKFPAQLADCRSALDWLANQADSLGLDRNRIGLFGYSAGGHLACLLGLSEPQGDQPPIRAIVAGGAPCDFRIVPPDTRMLDYWLGGSRIERPGVYRVASPATFASADDPPTFLYGGDRDWLVPAFTAQRLSQALADLNVPTEYFMCRDQGHLGALMNQQAFQRALMFLNKYLKDGDDNT
jgi:acetyl esterase/lipase